MEMWLQTADWKQTDAVLSAQLQKPAAEMSWRDGIVLDLAMDLADHYVAAKDDEAAVRLTRRVAAIRTERGLMDPAFLNRYYSILHGAAIRKKSPAALVEMYEEVVPVHAVTLGTDHRITLLRQMWLANALVDSGRAGEALEKIGEFHAQNEEGKQPDLPWRITEGRALIALDRFDEAQTILERAWQECLDLGYESPKADVATKQSAHRTASSLVTLSERTGRTEERLEWLRIRENISRP